MKKLLVVLLVALSFSSFSQIRKIPGAVTEAFKQKYPQAAEVEWKDKLTVFVASFLDDGVKYEARFNSKGTWQQTENETTEASIPSEVKDGLEKSKYAEWETTAFYHISLPDDKTQYRVSVKKNDIQKKNLLFSSEGQLLKDNITL
jgi:hypothetical protein